MIFDKEQDFENTIITALFTTYGWERDVLTNPTEQDLIDNWRASSSPTTANGIA